MRVAILAQSTIRGDRSCNMDGSIESRSKFHPDSLVESNQVRSDHGDRQETRYCDESQCLLDAYPLSYPYE